jgi:hypothetical protein
MVSAPAGAQIRLTETGGGTDYIQISAPSSVTTSAVWTLPGADGAANSCLVTDGAGSLGFKTCSAANAYSLSADDGAPANAVYAETAGRIGMGTTAPSSGASLEISGATSSNSSVLLPRDTTANRPVTGVNGMLRYNTDLASFEGYQAGSWMKIGNSHIGKVEIAPAANCRWLNASGAAYADLAADTDCGAMTASGTASAPGTKIPAIVLTDLPAGDYEVVANGGYAQITSSQQCRWRLFDGTNASGMAASNMDGEYQGGPMKGIFTYTSAGTRTIRVQSYAVSGTASACAIDNSTSPMRFEIYVNRL